jgi:hypothetical protein
MNWMAQFCTGLTYLDLTSCSISAEMLNNFPKLKSLKTLKLSNNSFMKGESSLRMAPLFSAIIDQCSSLEILELENTKLSDADFQLEHFAANLKTLNLSGCLIGDKAAAHLAKV